MRRMRAAAHLDFVARPPRGLVAPGTAALLKAASAAVRSGREGGLDRGPVASWWPRWTRVRWVSRCEAEGGSGEAFGTSIKGRGIHIGLLRQAAHARHLRDIVENDILNNLHSFVPRQEGRAMDGFRGDVLHAAARHIDTFFTKPTCPTQEGRPPPTWGPVTGRR